MYSIGSLVVPEDAGYHSKARNLNIKHFCAQVLYWHLYNGDNSVYLPHRGGPRVNTHKECDTLRR